MFKFKKDSFLRKARLNAVVSLRNIGFDISDDTLKKYKIKSSDVDLHIASNEDNKLIDIANEILLGRMTRASNGGGGFENVTLIKCTGVVVNPYNHKIEVRYDVDDSWICGVYYEKEHIMKMYKEYKDTGKLPELM